jgi:hypothetical protein
MFKSIKKTTGLVVIVAAGVTAMGGHAFTAGNTQDATAKSGSATTAVSGYTVTGVKYTYSVDGATVTGVDFDLDSPASSVSVRLDSSALSRIDCGATTVVATKDHVACTGLTTAQADHDQLSIAAQS